MTEPAKPFTFPCPTPGCTATYRAKPEYFGKYMRCQGCQQKIQVPSAPSLAKSQSARPPQPSRRTQAAPEPARLAAPSKSEKIRVRCPHCAATCGIRADWQGREVQCPSCSKPFKVSDSSVSQRREPPPVPEPPPEPLFASEDDAPGFAFEDDGGYEVSEDPAPLPLAPAATDWEAPAAAETTLQQSPVKRKKKRTNSLQWLEDIVDSPKLLFLFGGVVALILIVCGIFFAPLALGMRLIGGLFVAGGFIYALRMAFDESPTCGVFYLLDCTSVYRLYYTVTRWSDMKHAFFAETFGLLLFVPWVVLTTEQVFDQVPRFQMGAMEEDDDEGEIPPGFFDRRFGAPGDPVNRQDPIGNDGAEDQGS